ncbi:MAG: hypothetical protein DLM52_07525 [Chthoniobacterales bacterium]|nr:MAG: hypothetical protein DLM52_07525 [Chthoniobacterales bacterium]
MISAHLFRHVEDAFSPGDIDSVASAIVEDAVSLSPDRECGYLAACFAIKDDNARWFAATYEKPAVRLV